MTKKPIHSSLTLALSSADVLNTAYGSYLALGVGCTLFQTAPSFPAYRNQNHLFTVGDERMGRRILVIPGPHPATIPTETRQYVFRTVIKMSYNISRTGYCRAVSVSENGICPIYVN